MPDTVFIAEFQEFFIVMQIKLYSSPAVLSCYQLFSQLIKPVDVSISTLSPSNTERRFFNSE
ncbi:MAG: hypothetical protein DSY33_01760 [Archaeoglobus sp.]|jgi:hypothetical protein|nr:MAG: hypothetical protein DSY33_01760 [Archaeoglobus sp.]